MKTIKLIIFSTLLTFTVLICLFYAVITLCKIEIAFEWQALTIFLLFLVCFGTNIKIMTND